MINWVTITVLGSSKGAAMKEDLEQSDVRGKKVTDHVVRSH